MTKTVSSLDEFIREVGTAPLKMDHVDLPTGHRVFVREMSAQDWEEYHDSLFEAGADGERKLNVRQAREKLLVRTLCDGEGRLLFAEDKAGGLDALAKFSNSLIERLTQAAQRVNGIGAEERQGN